MQYTTIFTFPSWEHIGLAVLQTTTIFCLVLVGLHVVGRRVFAQRGPQDLILIVLVAEACDLGLAPEEAGYWGTVASVLTLFVLGYVTERVPLLRHLLNEKPIPLYSEGKLHYEAMKKHMIDVEDLEEVAREEGSLSYKDFDVMMLEGDGTISAIRSKTK